MSEEALELEEIVFAFLKQKYTQRADARQREMGLQYTTAETRDLAREMAAFIRSRGLDGGMGLTVGGGLSVFGSHDAIMRAQSYILIDSRHPVELSDNQRYLARQLRQAEAALKNSGICMSCLGGHREMLGEPCTDCLNTGWDGGRPNLAVENRDLRQAVKVALRAIETGRSEPLYAARDHLKNTLEDIGESAL